MALTSLTPGHPTPSVMAPTSTMLADSPMLPPMALTSPPLDSLMIVSPASASPPKLLPTAPSLLSPKFGPDSDCNKENIPPKLATLTLIQVNVVVANLLAALALAASKVQLPPLPLGPTPPIVPPAPNGADSESTTQNHTGLSTADDATTSKTMTVSTKSGTKGKMRPSGTKNGHNLCAQRWLKKLKINRTTEEFCAYYGDLTPAQRKLYDDESVSLEQDLFRRNDVLDPNHFSPLQVLTDSSHLDPSHILITSYSLPVAVACKPYFVLSISVPFVLIPSAMYIICRPIQAHS
ncbi:hypothetical protein EV702DRAFT_1195159 [Suillus placidus]|uniref:Uncharacterized protein n=1 Tax=Suillus placidus TaxID=48579 RepID=A0A9P6ZZV5_9AGAM|nr:hypothetical protein EV702DRAFT_1195159 [Suillus placidus]